MWTPHKFIFALLSDNQNIIEDYKELNTKNNNGYPPLQDCYKKPREGRFNVWGCTRTAVMIDCKNEDNQLQVK